MSRRIGLGVTMSWLGTFSLILASTPIGGSGKQCDNLSPSCTKISAKWSTKQELSSSDSSAIGNQGVMCETDLNRSQKVQDFG